MEGKVSCSTGSHNGGILKKIEGFIYWRNKKILDEFNAGKLYKQLAEEYLLTESGIKQALRKARNEAK